MFLKNYRKIIVLTVSVLLVFLGFKFFSVYFLKKALVAQDDAEKLRYLSKSVSLLNDEARLVRAMTYIEMKQSSSALKDLNFVAKKHPDYPVTFMYLGNAYYDTGDYAASLASYDSALTLLPQYIKSDLTDSKATEKLSGAYGLTANQVADSITVKLYLDRAGTLAALKRFADALTDVEKARAIAPLDPYVYVTRSEIYAKIGNKKLAAEDYNHAFALKRQMEEEMAVASKQIEEQLKKQMSSAAQSNNQGQLFCNSFFYNTFLPKSFILNIKS